MSFPKVRSAARYNPIPDLTPLADVAWLICIFLMLTTRIRIDEPQMVDLPTTEILDLDRWSHPSLKVMIDAQGNAWIRIPRSLKLEVLRQHSIVKHRRPSPGQVAQFLVEADINYRPDALFSDPAIGGTPKQQGIASAEWIGEWLVICKKIDPRLGVQILGDQNAPYPAIEKVFSALQARNVNRFSLLTTLEKEELQR